MALGRQSLTFRGNYAVFYFAEFHHKLPVSGIIHRIGHGIVDIDIRTVKAGPHFTGKKKRPGDPDGTDRIQFIGIKQYARFRCLWLMVSSEPMGSHAVNDVFLLGFRKREFRQNRWNHLRALLGMAYRTIGRILVAPADIVEICGTQDNLQFNPFNGTDMPAEPEHAQGMIPRMTAAGIFEKRSSTLPYASHCRIQRFRVRISIVSVRRIYRPISSI